MRRSATFMLSLAAMAAAPCAYAAVTISSGATQNMSCSNGVCAPTASDAVLNITDLENDLAAGNLTVLTTGSGGVQATDIEMDAAVSWVSSNTFALDAFHSVRIMQPMSVTGGGGLSVRTNDGGSGGTFAFAPAANADFWSLSSPLAINGASYTLVGDLKTLRKAISENPSGNFALAGNYDATPDGTYKNAVITSRFGGNFEGLGNTVSKLSIKGTGDINTPVGLFSMLADGNTPGGFLENVRLQNIRINGAGLSVGGLVGFNTGTVVNAFVQGKVSSTLQQGPEVAILVGANSGNIISSGARGSVAGPALTLAGGLVGDNSGMVDQCYADSTISIGESSYAGGLVGDSQGMVSRSYAIGSIGAGNGSQVGGLAGVFAQAATTAQAYSTTKVKSFKAGYRGGFVGIDGSSGNSSDYWDTSTSGISKQSKGAGNVKNDPGITGLTSAQLQTALPEGFDPAVWSINANINNGFPYLIANPPQ